MHSVRVLGRLARKRNLRFWAPKQFACPTNTPNEDFGSPRGSAVANWDSILDDVDKEVHRQRRSETVQPPALEFIFSEAALPQQRLHVRNLFRYGHAALRYTLPNGEQKLVNICGLFDKEMVHFLSPSRYLFGTHGFEDRCEQGGIYNRAFCGIRIENVAPERLLCLFDSRFHCFCATLAHMFRSRSVACLLCVLVFVRFNHSILVFCCRALEKREKAGITRFQLVGGRIRNVVSRYVPLLRDGAEQGNCAYWCSSALSFAGLLYRQRIFPKAIWWELLEKNAGNATVVYYDQCKHAKERAFIEFEHGDGRCFGSPLQFVRNVSYLDMRRMADVVVSVPEGSALATVTPGEAHRPLRFIPELHAFTVGASLAGAAYAGGTKALAALSLLHYWLY
ncbi:MAG: hypothetical protein MHM6MM_000060 [Cercozoa sp. M6MM]